jgi:hypothetical protein
MNSEPEQELKSAEGRWTAQMKLLGQISYRLLAEQFSEVYEWDARRTATCLAEMQKLLEDLPKNEPFGDHYADLRRGLRECVTALEKSLALLVEAKKAAFAHASESGWKRVLESSRR